MNVCGASITDNWTVALVVGGLLCALLLVGLVVERWNDGRHQRTPAYRKVVRDRANWRSREQQDREARDDE